MFKITILIRNATRWDDHVNVIFVHAHSAKPQYESLVDVKRSRNTTDKNPKEPNEKKMSQRNKKVN